MAKTISDQAPLSASEVAKTYRVDKCRVLTACRLFVQSGGKRGLRHFRSGNRIRIRPVAVDEWFAELERDTARCAQV